MKAIVWTKYGTADGLQLQDVEKPTPKENEILIKIIATSVTAGDYEIRNLQFPMWLALPLRLYIGVRNPFRIPILGQEFSGEIEAIGKNVKNWKVGDSVYATTGFSFGAYAEYLCLPANPEDMDGAIAIKPSNINYEEATTFPVGGLEALHFLRQANLQRGQKILINGAGGSIGTVAIQLAKSYGLEVTAVDSTAKLDMLRSIGADYVIDYTKEDFTQRGERYDVIFDVIGKGSYADCLRVLNENGYYLLGNSMILGAMRALWTRMTSNKKIVTGTSDHKVADLDYLREQIEAGTIKPVIDRYYPLGQVPDAHRYVESGQKMGNVVINVAVKDPQT
jgi:NADPH:quinone reductase-like Zn-dependent oxidoreductase